MINYIARILFPNDDSNFAINSESEVAQSRPTLCDPWTVAHQAPPSMGFSRQEHLSGLPFPSPGDLPDPGIEPRSPTLQADALTSAPPGKPPCIPNLVISYYLNCCHCGLSLPAVLSDHMGCFVYSCVNYNENNVCLIYLSGS